MGSASSGSILTTPDVLVVGGGAAGVAAAEGAFRNGASVTLIEKNAFAGGKATAAYVATICGLYYRSENPVVRNVHAGVPFEFSQQLISKGSMQPIHHKNGLHFLPYNHFDFVLLCDEWLKKSTQSLCFHSQLFNAVAENETITSVKAMVNNREIIIQPKTVIDASGENLLAHLLKINSIQSDQYQAAAGVFRVSGISETDAGALSLGLIRSVQKGIAAKLLDAHFERVSVVPGSLWNANALLKLPILIPVNHEELHRTGLELFFRKEIQVLMTFLKSTSDTFKHAHIAFVAPEAGVRTGPRNEGKYILTGNDVLSAKKQNNSIARGAWPVEFWEPEKNVAMEYFEMDDYYDIPATTIQSKHIKNLFFAGRNISADDKAIASARVIGTCLATGFAAGVLASFHALNKSEADAITNVQSALSIK